jgi:uroporphyrinogen decarboxylase
VSEMTSRELVIAAIEFEGPERIPYSVWIDTPRFRRDRSAEDLRVVEELLANAPQDWVELWPAPIKEWRSVDGPRVDEWGVTWNDNYPRAHPLEGGWELLDDYQFPDPHSPERFAHVPDVLKGNEDKYKLATVWYTIFERLWTLRGMTNLLRDQYRYRDKFTQLRDRVLEFNTELIKAWLEIGVDGIFFSDDWGTQEGLLINPGLWRELYKPHYERLFAMVHDGGAHVWLHSCGNIMEIIPDLIEVGLDVLNPIQSRAMDVDEVARKFGRALCVWGGLDVQMTVPHGSPEDIDREVQHLVEVFGSHGGGYIGGTSHTILPDAPVANIKAVFEAFQKHCGAR